jgi:hypothetical protein
MSNEYRMNGLAHDAPNLECGFNPASNPAETHDMIKEQIDFNFDMIYIRCHVRARPTASPGTPTRLHYNVVSNQEIVYDTNDKLARYHLKTKDIGPVAGDAHNSLLRKQKHSATLIVP